MAATRVLPALAKALRALPRILRALVGAPDYDRYLAHMRTHHPAAPALGPREFAEQRSVDRYSRPGSRCC